MDYEYRIAYREFRSRNNEAPDWGNWYHYAANRRGKAPYPAEKSAVTQMKKLKAYYAARKYRDNYDIEFRVEKRPVDGWQPL